MSQTKSPEQLHGDSYMLEPEGNGWHRLSWKDPFSGERLVPDRPPLSIEAEPELRGGLDYLRRRGNSINLSIVGAPHDDETEVDMRQLMNLQEVHDVVFFEGLGHTQAQRDLLWDVSAGERTIVTEEESRGLGAYKVRQLAALAGSQKPAFFADVPGDSAGYERALLEWFNLLPRLRGAEGHPEDVALGVGINLTGTTILHEWYMLATIGKQLRELDELAGYQVVRPMLLVGAHHTETLPYKLRALGVNSSVVSQKLHSEGRHEYLDLPFDFLQAVAACAISTQLRT